MKLLILMALASLGLNISGCTSSKQTATPVQALNPMESVVCDVDSDYCIVRDDARRNAYTLRSSNDMELALDVHFEKYLDTFQVEGHSFLAAAYWNPAFGYLWNAWVRDIDGWHPLFDQPVSDLKVVTEPGQSAHLDYITMPDSIAGSKEIHI